MTTVTMPGCPPLPPPRPEAADPGWGEGVAFPGIGHRPGFPAGDPAQLENLTVWPVWA
ncbi:hypothetical protein ABT063_40275 [Streptomyces sp. NPDC002838]|uniref:hypothetical protein n=1 Tax=Streptomyces sp. NPDC002838 TaxID=3154436 RepID=UPI00333141AC